ncbi:cold shock domain-containing protein [Escherichia coli]|uniref:CSD domain-containing protein n=1 Tax=Kluyvera intermedia TaxID=61648 RepID=A0ABX6DQU0_KLUIN|nr:hypothetical protein [Salmonella enterica]ECB8555470.1 hypothetical protein [Salmonella enterica subsp. enterica serovar 4,[5],12:i:-]EFL1172875.1 cold shock domain-containing protein [Escherichia coli]QGH31176.1 hypothetical protein GHC21_16520 [Kluyvera intermedia]QGH40158.1 hypothetical protein GHC38_16520 [Kluyvera intermedia]
MKKRICLKAYPYNWHNKLLHFGIISISFDTTAIIGRRIGIVQWSPYFNTAGEVRYDILSVKGLIIPSESRKDVQLHISVVNSRKSELLITGSRIEFCRMNRLRGPVAENIYLF